MSNVIIEISDVSEVSEEDEGFYILDPSDPRAHTKSDRKKNQIDSNKVVENQNKIKNGMQRSKNKNNNQVKDVATRWDSSSEVDEELPQKSMSIQTNSNKDKKEKHPSRLKNEESETSNATVNQDVPKLNLKLSNWAMTRFFTTRNKDAKSIVEELPIEPLNDFILSDFSARHRGATSTSVIEESPSDEDSNTTQDTFQVGKPMFDETTNVTNDEQNNEQKLQKENANKRQKKESRYFVTDLGSKCYNCGQLGHLANLCQNDKVSRPCYYCAERGHFAADCPKIPCANCHAIGHHEDDCEISVNKVPHDAAFCSSCGRRGHAASSCPHSLESKKTTNLQSVICMVCLSPGHLHCVPIPAPEDGKLYCANCNRHHTVHNCRSYLPTQESLRFVPKSKNGYSRSPPKCFICESTEHLAGACPNSNKGKSHHKQLVCFRCGGEGHIAVECDALTTRANARRLGTLNGITGMLNESNRKRRRIDYDNDSDEDEDYVYTQELQNTRYTSSSSNNKKRLKIENLQDPSNYRYRNGKSSNRYTEHPQNIRLDAALPTPSKKYRPDKNRNIRIDHGKSYRKHNNR